MNSLNTLETKLADLSARLPNLPKDARRWIAINTWWIVALMAVIASIVVLNGLSGLFKIAALPAYLYGAVSINSLLTTAVVNVALVTIPAIVLWIAIGPLRSRSRRGWRLLFIGLLMGVLCTAIGALLVNRNFNANVFVAGILLAAAELYVLFQIRGEFGVKAKIKRKIASKTASKKTTKKSRR